jgi:hypothetical protein
MTHIFFSIIVLFSLFVLIFLVVNDFSTDAVMFLYPAVGAILASAFFAYKSIWIDAPSPIVSEFTVGVMYDADSVKIHSMYEPLTSEMDRDTRDFRGYTTINNALRYNVFKKLDLKNYLKPNSDNYVDPNKILEIVEFSILYWLSQYVDLSVGYEGTYSLMVGSGGGGGGPTQKLVPSKVDFSNRKNIFISTMGLSLELPKGAKITLGKTPGVFTISTPHSIIKFKAPGFNRSRFETAVTPLGTTIRERNGISIVSKTPNLSIYGFQFSTTFQQNSFMRMSDQSKTEKRWLDNLRERLTTEFSFERLRSIYIESL